MDVRFFFLFSSLSSSQSPKSNVQKQRQLCGPGRCHESNEINAFLFFSVNNNYVQGAAKREELAKQFYVQNERFCMTMASTWYYLKILEATFSLSLIQFASSFEFFGGKKEQHFKYIQWYDDQKSGNVVAVSREPMTGFFFGCIWLLIEVAEVATTHMRELYYGGTC